MKLDLNPMLSVSDYEQSQSEPVPMANNQLVFFRNRILKPERQPLTALEWEQVFLRAKKIIFDEEAELNGLREQVVNLEAALEYRKKGPKRTLIPDDVRLLVWTRDGGACVLCGSKTALHFDHVIPVAKGGGNSGDNIQILCAVCNLKKSDKIASP